MRRFALPVAAVAVLLAGCRPPKPAAPAVTRDPVYEDAAAGLRFDTPPGWFPVSRARLPSGPLPTPQIAASYMQPAGERPTEFELLVADPVADGRLEQFLLDNPIGWDNWVTKEKPAAAEVNGVPAERLVLTRPSKRGEVIREVTVFRRPDRTYLFYITFLGTDRAARDVAHQCVESITWK